MIWRRWGRILAVLAAAGILGAAPTAARAQGAGAAAADEEMSATNILAGIAATLGSLAYAPFKAVVLCPASAVGAGATWLATGGQPFRAGRVLQIGCEGDYFISRSMVRGQQEFREPDAPEQTLEGQTIIRYQAK